MSNFNKLHMNALLDAIWYGAIKQKRLTENERNWLMDAHSMTERLKKHCETLSVELLSLQDAKEHLLSEKEHQVIGKEGGILREVLIYGDNLPWLCARTCIPNSTLTGKEQDIAHLGSIPLGYRIFKEEGVRRDEIEIAFVEVNGRHLLARRSCLWVNHKVLFVSELFLPQAPIYKKET